MSYSTGASTGPDDLLDKLRIFLLADGWTVNLWDTDNTMKTAWDGLIGTGKRLHVQKAAVGDGTVMYFNFRSVNRGVIFSNYNIDSTLESYSKYRAEITGIGMNGSTGYDVGETWDEQPGHTQTDSGDAWGVCMTELSLSAIPAYHFVSVDDTVIVAVEYESSKFQWFCFGCLEKEGVYTGGQFFTGSVPSYAPSDWMCGSTVKTDFFAAVGYLDYGHGAVYLTADGNTGWRSCGDQGSDSGADYANELWMPSFAPYETPSYGKGYASILGYFFSRSPNYFNALAPFAPLYMLVTRTSGNRSLVGIPAGIRYIAPKYYDAGDEVSYGGDTWKIFPSHAKLDDQGDYIGFAVLAYADTYVLWPHPYDDITVVDYVYCDITPVSGAVEDDIGVTDYVNVAVV